jgi:hypothetical protein
MFKELQFTLATVTAGKVSGSIILVTLSCVKKNFRVGRERETKRTAKSPLKIILDLGPKARASVLFAF